MKLWAISDVHIGYGRNRTALEQLEALPDDWLLLGGDVGERASDVRYAFELFARRFSRVIWVPGNHELWSLSGPDRIDSLRGERRYLALVELARSFGIVTPEDPYPQWPAYADADGGTGRRLVIAPLFTLYDYSFRPANVEERDARAWAAQNGIECADEHLLHAEPFASVAAWCRARCKDTEIKLSALEEDTDTILVNHFPLRREHAVLPRIPRFSIWCGTTITADWHRRFRARVVVTGHLHIRSTRWLDGVRFEEVSLGQPSQWPQGKTLQQQLRKILPLPTSPTRRADQD